MRSILSLTTSNCTCICACTCTHIACTYTCEHVASTLSLYIHVHCHSTELVLQFVVLDH